ncbi:acyl carrier protein [Candidatus Mycolicibacterium alkanivorans]|uniref:Acyl carrier protein n=1 Tax=Candidatus Mycolicibacterium alkanivorans TaxID=2954114 RepID=A0ABS9YZE7_9MYCO|nr:acyl carrier protein [Candidatus Mycolicibacterium alkanivorans]MCI4676641.1 acyl carrier protein [Candidatus Mycolicibacterium alkanivorans]
MAESQRDRILAALSEVLYIDESDLFDGDATDLRDLGLDSVRFVLLLKHLGVDRESDVPGRLANDLSIAGWVRELEGVRDPA